MWPAGKYASRFAAVPAVVGAPSTAGWLSMPGAPGARARRDRRGHARTAAADPPHRAACTEPAAAAAIPDPRSRRRRRQRAASRSSRVAETRVVRDRGASTPASAVRDQRIGDRCIASGDLRPHRPPRRRRVDPPHRAALLSRASSGASSARIDRRIHARIDRRAVLGSVGVVRRIGSRRRAAVFGCGRLRDLRRQRLGLRRRRRDLDIDELDLAAPRGRDSHHARRDVREHDVTARARQPGRAPSRTLGWI